MNLAQLRNYLQKAEKFDDSILDLVIPKQSKSQSKK